MRKEWQCECDANQFWMATPMTDSLTPAQQAIVEHLLHCPPDQREPFIAAQQDLLSIALIEAIKQRSDDLILVDPAGAKAMVACALLVARYLHHDPYAYPLALWARGNWEMHNDPQAAIQSYEECLAHYRQMGHDLNIARVQSNLAGVYADCEHHAEARSAYEEAQSIFARLDAETRVYQQCLEQNYGYALHYQGWYEQALIHHERAYHLALQINEPEYAAESQINRTLSLMHQGYLDESEENLLRQREIVEHLQQAVTVARVDLHLGELYTVSGRPAEALRRLMDAQKQFAELENLEVATALLFQGKLFARIGSRREARRSYAEARARFEQEGRRPFVGKALLWQATVSRQEGHYAQTIRLLDQAEDLWTSLDHDWWRTHVQFERIELALAQGDADTALALLPSLSSLPDNAPLHAHRDILRAEILSLHGQQRGTPAPQNEARRMYEHVLNYAQSHHHRWIERRAWVGLGRLVWMDSPDEARHFLEQAVACDEIIRRSLSVEELKAGFLFQTNDVLTLLVRLAVEQGDPVRALRFAWDAKGSGLCDLLHEVSPHHPESSPLDESIAQVRQHLARTRWQSAIQAIDYGCEVAYERDNPAIAALEHQLADLRRQRNHAIIATDTPMFDDPQAVVQSMEADVLIEYVTCQGDILAIRTDRDSSCRAIWLTDEDTILDLLDELHLTFQHVLVQPIEAEVETLHATSLPLHGPSESSKSWLTECLPLLQRGYDLLVAPLGPLPPDGHLLIAPSHPLEPLPFAALHDGQHYLVESQTIEFLPSGALLTAPRPAFVATTASLIVASTAEARLTGVQEEVAALQAVFPASTSLVDDPHDLDTLTHLSSAPDMLHLIAHSIVRDDAPILSSLHLRQGLLSVEHCYAMPLAGTRLVTLSACTTSTGMDTGGSLLAFPMAFLVAGAHRVVSSLWDIRSSATAFWMSHFYSLLAHGHSVPTALCLTQRAFLDAPSLSHPAFWAAFLCHRR
jgi:hypothetical protein